MPKFENLAGRRFGYLTVLARYKQGQPTRWICECDCGKLKLAYSGRLKKGITTSCGCDWSEKFQGNSSKHGFCSGNKKHPIYLSWRGMKRRCYSPTCRAYKNYGGRGIKVCQRWLDSFENFLVDMGDTWMPDLTLERRDNSQGYSPENCYWATRREQVRNRRNTVFVDYRGETKPLAEWCEVLGLEYTWIKQRYEAGWTASQMFETPKWGKRK